MNGNAHFKIEEEVTSIGPLRIKIGKGELVATLQLAIRLLKNSAYTDIGKGRSLLCLKGML